MKYILKFFLILLVLLASALLYNYWPESTLPANTKATRLIIYKSERKLELWENKNLVKCYRISLGGNPIGHKQHQGDQKTPEGKYFIDSKNPNSDWHLNLGISYPNAKDRLNAKKPGGAIKIHGMRDDLAFIGKLHRLIDWTNGCVAVTNQEMDELYQAVAVGTPIEIYP